MLPPSKLFHVSSKTKCSLEQLTYSIAMAKSLGRGNLCMCKGSYDVEMNEAGHVGLRWIVAQIEDKSIMNHK